MWQVVDMLAETSIIQTHDVETETFEAPKKAKNNDNTSD